MKVSVVNVIEIVWCTLIIIVVNVIEIVWGVVWCTAVWCTLIHRRY